MKQNTKKLVLAPSLISLDDCNMVGLTSSLEKCGFDTLHVDIIDGYFSPDMPLGVTSVVRLAPKTGLKFDVHLMVNDNHFFVDEMLKANPHQMCFHLETEPHPDMLLSHIRRHGVRAGEDPRLVEELARRRVPLELCPTSNLQTKAVPDLAHFPLKKYLAQGVAATVNTDNMTVSRTTLAQEFASLRLAPQERRAVLLHSVEAAFLPPAQKAALRQAVEAALAH